VAGKIQAPSLGVFEFGGHMSKKKKFTSQYFFVSIMALMLTTWLLGPEPKVMDSAFTVDSVKEHASGTHNLLNQIDTAVSSSENHVYLDDTDLLLAGKNTAPKSGFNVSFRDVEDALMMAKLDNVGALILDEQALASLNLVVSRLPDHLTPQDLQKIQNLIKQAQPGEAGEQVAQVLGDYYAFKQAETKWLKSGVATNSLQAAIDQLEKITAMRQDYLGQDVADKLFLAQQEQASLSLQKMAIQQDTERTVQQKDSEMALLNASNSSSSPDLNETADQQVKQLNSDVQSMRQAGATQHDIHALRVDVLGEQAASQMVAMEQQQQQWDSRYQSYSQEKQPILDSALSEADKQQQIEALLSAHYSNDELAGARAYDAQQVH